MKELSDCDCLEDNIIHRRCVRSSAGPRGRCGGRGLPVVKQSPTGAEPDEEVGEDEGDRLVTPSHKEPL